MRRILLIASAAALAFSVTTALAQDAGKAKSKTPPAPRSAASIECSKRADAKGLHGKTRKTFRSRCRRDLAKTAKSKT